MTNTLQIEQQIQREFIEIPLRPGTMFHYAPRTGILRAVRGALPLFSGDLLDVGCGFMPYRDLILSNSDVRKYIGMDLADSGIYGSVRPDLIWEGTTIPLNDRSVDSIIATEFLEHHADPDAVVSEFFRVLKPGGSMFATVPFIWNLHELPYDEFRYTPTSLKRIFENAGFAEVTVRPLGGWNAAMAQMIGLWVTFAPLRRPLRRVFRYVLFPIFYALLKSDVLPSTFDGRENSMFNGLSVTARR